MIDAILQDPHPLLREPCKVVRDFTGVKALADRMIASMVAAGGAGLAANQIGVLQRVIVVDYGGRQVLVNPVIKWKRGEQRVDDGCLSVENGTRREYTARAAEIFVEFNDSQGASKRMRVKGLKAAVIQHEVDHLDGKLFIDLVTAAA